MQFLDISVVHCYEEKLVFIYGEDITNVLSKYKGLPSIKKDIGNYRFLSIRPMNDGEVDNLEKLIVQRRKMSLKTVKERCYYSLNHNNSYTTFFSIVTIK